MVDAQFVATKAFILNNSDVLIVKEDESYSDGANPGTYDLVGGRIEPGEHFQSSLAREVHEETGLDIMIDKPVHVDEWRPEVDGERWQIIGIYFRCRTNSRDVSLGPDHSDYNWIEPQQYANHPIIDDLDTAFEQLIAVQTNHTSI